MDAEVLLRTRSLPRRLYVNFLGGDEETDPVREAYGNTVYSRLVEVKTTYDARRLPKVDVRLGPDEIRLEDE